MVAAGRLVGLARAAAASQPGSDGGRTDEQEEIPPLDRHPDTLPRVRRASHPHSFTLGSRSPRPVACVAPVALVLTGPPEPGAPRRQGSQRTSRPARMTEASRERVAERQQRGGRDRQADAEAYRDDQDDLPALRARRCRLRATASPRAIRLDGWVVIRPRPLNTLAPISGSHGVLSTGEPLMRHGRCGLFLARADPVSAPGRRQLENQSSPEIRVGDGVAAAACRPAPGRGNCRANSAGTGPRQQTCRIGGVACSYVYAFACMSLTGFGAIDLGLAIRVSVTSDSKRPGPTGQVRWAFCTSGARQPSRMTGARPGRRRPTSGCSPACRIRTERY